VGQPSRVSYSADPGRNRGNLFAGPFSPEHFADLFFLVLICGSVTRFWFWLAHLNPQLAAVWAPTGVALTAFLLKSYRIWPAVFLGTLLGNVASGAVLPMAVVVAFGNTLEGVVASYLVQRYAGGLKAFSKPSYVLRYILLAGLLATSISATIGASSLCHWGATNAVRFLVIWRAWWVGHALGVVILAPFLILLLDGSHKPLDFWELLEATFLLVGLCVACVLNFGPPVESWSRGYGPVFLCAPFLVWAALRFCPLEASGASILLCGFATWGSLHGLGPFAHSPQAPLLLAGYVGVCSTMTLTIAATVAEHRETVEALLNSLCTLESEKARQIQVLKNTLEVLPERLPEPSYPPSCPNRFSEPTLLSRTEVVWVMNADPERILYVSPTYEGIWGQPVSQIYEDPHSWLDAVVPEDQNRVLNGYVAAVNEGKIDTEFRIVRSDGSIRWIHNWGFVIRDEHGVISRVVGVATDVTEKRTGEQPLSVKTDPNEQR